MGKPVYLVSIDSFFDSFSFIFSFLIGGPKVYDVTKYLDDHPGGAEVLLDVGGQDADEFFEDIGHSNDAREELKKHLVGTLYLDPEEIKRREEAAAKAAANGSGGMNLMVLIIALVAIGYGYYVTQMK